MGFSKIILTSGMVASIVLTIVNPVYAAESKSYKSNGIVQFIPNTGPTDPVDPDSPEKPVKPIDPTNPDGPEPGTDGPLSIDYASSLDFGTNMITNRDVTYYAKAQEIEVEGGSKKWVPNYVQVSDNRGTNAGWVLTVKQGGQFENKETQNKKLTGAEIKITNAKAVSNAIDMTAPVVKDITLDPSGSESVVMEAKKGTGAGTWLSKWGEVASSKGLENKTTAISLSVPGKTPKDAVKYSTKLTWKLADVPDESAVN